jgi:hypothetical protein
MLYDQGNTQEIQVRRKKKLSPELSEFLHMLDALENQMDAREAAVSQTR